MNTFDPEKHEYRIGGFVVPSVTQVIRSLVPTWNADSWYLQAGKAAHSAIELMLHSRLDWDSVDPRIAGRVKAVYAFLQSMPALRIIAVEQQIYDEDYMFAGTVDAVAKDASGHLTLIDWKASLSPAVELQLGAYSLAYPEIVNRVCAVETHDDGTFKCKWGVRNPKTKGVFDLGKVERVYLAALSVYQWRVANYGEKQ